MRDGQPAPLAHNTPAEEGSSVVDDYQKEQQAEGHMSTPDELAAWDVEQATKMRAREADDRSMAAGLDGISGMLEAAGMSDAATDARGMAERASDRAQDAGEAAYDFDRAARGWKTAEHDIAEQARLSGDAVVAGRHAATEARTAGAHPEYPFLRDEANQASQDEAALRQSAGEAGNRATADAQLAESYEAQAFERESQSEKPID